MEQSKPSKSISTSTPSFSIRYNPEDEEIEQLYDQPKLAEAHSDNSSPQSTPVAEKKAKDKSARRSGSFEDGPPNDKEPPWRLLTEIRGRITKRVEEKLEEIKTERLIKDKMKKEKRDKKLKTTNSLSDSEDRSEDTSAAHLSSLSNASSSSPEKTKSLPVPSASLSAGADESDLGDISGSEDASSSPERPSTPTFTDDLVLHRPRPLSSSSAVASDEKKDLRCKMKGIKFKIIKKKPSPELSSTVEVGVDALDEVPPGKSNVRNLSTDALPVPMHKYHISVHKYPWTAVASLAALLLAYFFQRPSFLAGILVGIFLSFMAALWSDKLYQWVRVPDPENNFLHGNYTCQNVPFLSENALKTESIPPEEKYYKGWMNEYLDEYDPQTYHISQTESVYVKLVGSILRLSTPRYKIPKRAFCNEPKHKLKFTKERAFDIARCDVKLLPEGLIHKRLWSRKYPIVINLLPTSHLGTRWAEGRKQFLGDSDFAFEPTKNPSTKEKIESTDKRGDSSSPPSPVRSSSGAPSSEKIVSKDSPTHRGKEKANPEMSPKKETSEEAKSSASNGLDDTPSMTINEVGDEGDDEEDFDEVSDFVKVSPVAERSHIVLFARTAREKDLWFRRFVAATTYCSKSELGDELTEDCSRKKERRCAEIDNYTSFMKSLGQFRCSFEDEFGVVSFDNTNKEKENYLWFNIFLARILYDTMNQEFWIELMKSKIQKKLSVIRVPTFMEPITLSKIQFADTVPAIEWTHNVNLNDDGIWTEVEISYQGTMTMTVDTKINVIKLKELAHKNQLPVDKNGGRPSKTAYMDSSQEDSGETSTEESTDKPTTANKALSYIDKVAASGFFHKVTETGLGRKAVERMSNTVISLNVQVKSLVGTLVLNIPPPPSDRLWYGFKPNVEINMHAKPVFGETNINMHYITSMIEKTLRSEFQKVLVMPNMDDLVIPLMNKEMPF
ncbi:Testis expressed 2 [Nesidiocoris tenuis]|uniref:Testis expressed 2 n=1 Tax=Nesidiocoris tenuis TaxID=355587 RepID=A0ABN7B464_9HEMI|nr:Testis expressed 2 [Nesidiocoris tenuis]